MSDNFSHLSEEERLKAENDFLKMKLMLEHDAKFSESDSSQPPLPPQMENDFLNYVMAFEEQSKNPKYIKVFDRIERPGFFKPVAEIPEAEIAAEWEKLQDYLCKYHITLDVCSPNISLRELYRFTTEELFDHEMHDMNVPGMTTNFIYDEFHPDTVYDNERMATEDCIKLILNDQPLEWTSFYYEENLRLNEHFPVTIEQFSQLVQNYKSSYNTLEIRAIDCASCTVQGSDSVATGSYRIEATTNIDTFTITGSWKVTMKLDNRLGYWYISEVNIGGINF
ncbi:MAG: hypothetical protein KF746_06060 [Chitinophagaceae bacterium]|nr:hypothetical protein [Chitinophagaceae bacterium]